MLLVRTLLCLRTVALHLRSVAVVGVVQGHL
jgi:hypothetical protein